MVFPKWLSRNAFLTALLLTALATHKEAARTGYSIEGVAVWGFASLAGGFFWGAIITWIASRVSGKP